MIASVTMRVTPQTRVKARILAAWNDPPTSMAAVIERLVMAEYERQDRERTAQLRPKR